MFKITKQFLKHNGETELVLPYDYGNNEICQVKL